MLIKRPVPSDVTGEVKSLVLNKNHGVYKSENSLSVTPQ